MAYLKAYDVTLDIDDQASVFMLDNTMPSVHDWVSAVETATLLAKMDRPSASVSLLDCKEYVPSGLSNIEYFYPSPMVIQ